MSKLPPGWNETTMGEACEVVAGSTPKTQVQSYWNGDIPWITPDDLSRHSGKYIHNGARSITRAGYDSCSTHLVPAGTVLYTTRAPIGYAAIAAQPVCTNQGFKNFVPSDGVDSEYLYWYLRHATPAIREMGSGTTFKEVSGKVAKSITLFLPPAAQQRRIVEAIEEQLSRLDAAEDAVTRSRRNLERFRAAALADSFAGDFSPRPLGEVAQTQLGKMLSKKARRGGPGGRPYLRNKNVQWGRFDLSDVATMEFSEVEAEKFRLQEGDVLVCEGGEVGRAAVWRGELGDCYFQKAVHRLRPSAELLPDFLAYYLRRLSDTDGFERYVTGSTIDHLPQEDLRRIAIPVPNRKQQEHIVAVVEQRLSVAEAIEAALHVSLQRSAGLRQAILKEAFEGRLVPQNPSASLGSDLR